MENKDEALEYHRKERGKIKVEGKMPLDSMDDLNMAYTPGVAAPVRAIERDKGAAYDYTTKGDMVGILTNGSSVLGMGNTGPAASIPVMEGKAMILRKLAGVSGFPLVVDVEDTMELVTYGEKLQPMFGFMMVEDIESPDCFRVEDELKERLEIPVFHDDQHGIAIATLAGLKNALKIVNKSLEESRIVVVGAGAAGTATSKLLLEAGAEEILVVEKQGILYPGCDGMNWAQKEVAGMTNPDQEQGELEDALEGADVVVGLSTGGILSKEMVEAMADDPIVFALANPEPEILPAAAEEAGAAVAATGRSDFRNQINNSLVFPGIVKGALRCFASEVNTEMQLAAADALASMVDEPTPDRILPSSLEEEPVDAIADAVAEKADATGVCRTDI